MNKKFLLMAMLSLVVRATVVAQVAPQAGPLLGTWNGRLEVGATSLTVVVHFEQAEGYVVCTFDSPDQGAKGLGVYKEYLSADSVSLNIVQVGATYRARREGDRLVGTFSQMGMDIPLRLVRGEYKPSRPQTPQPPYPYKSEQVSFFNSSDNATLAATLTYPVGYEEGVGERVPVVIMVSGSGLQNRDEELFDHKPFLVIADHLARNGVASLRYDDRAFGASEGGDRIHNQATTLDYMRDAAAGVEYLRGLDRFGPVGVLGHSEGGSIAFMLGARGVVDFLISMAGVGVRGDEALAAQYNHILRLQGYRGEPATVEQYRQIAQSAQSDWMDWFLDYDPSADIAATTCPALVINGDKDCQVLSSLNLEAIRARLPHNDRTVIKEYPSLNHLFQHCSSGLPTEYNTIEQTISPEVLTDLAAWIGTLSWSSAALPPLVGMHLQRLTTVQ